MCGVVFGAPFVTYQVWRFIAPGLHRNEKRLLIPFLALAIGGTIAGALFSHYVLFPSMMAFFRSFDSPRMRFMPRVEDTFALYKNTLIGMVAVFQIPTLVFVLAKLGIVTARFLWRHLNYAVLVAFVAAAFLTPSPDPWNQLVFAAPMVAMYVLGIGIAWLVQPGADARAHGHSGSALQVRVRGQPLRAGTAAPRGGDSAVAAQGCRSTTGGFHRHEDTPDGMVSSAMPAGVVLDRPSGRDALLRLARAGVLTAITDGLFSSVLAVVFYQSTATRLFQGVAATLLGNDAFAGGLPTALVGVLMHVGVAFGWSAVFLFLVMRLSRVRELLTSRSGVIGVAAVYGPLIWMVMSLAVIPLLVHRPPAIGVRWWIQLAGHFPFVGLPIVASIARHSRTA